MAFVLILCLMELLNLKSNVDCTANPKIIKRCRVILRLIFCEFSGINSRYRKMMSSFRQPSPKSFEDILADFSIYNSPATLPIENA